MDTRSRSSRGIKGWLSSRRTRLGAFILACLFVGVSLTGFCYTQDMSGVSDRKKDYTQSDEYIRELEELYGELYVFSAAYLNTEKRDILLDSFMSFMNYNEYEYLRTDSGIIPVSDLFTYYVSYDNGDGIRYTTNSDLVQEYLGSHTEVEALEYMTKKYPGYILRRENSVSGDKVSSGGSINWWFPNAESGWHDIALYSYESYARGFVPVGGWFYDSYGRYFYNVGYDYNDMEPVILYADLGDKSRMNAARNGQVTRYIVYTFPGSEDDTSRMQEHYGVFYNELPEDILNGENYWWEEDIVSLESLDDYEAYQGKDEGMTIFIAPDETMLAKAETVYRRLSNNYLIARAATVAGAGLAAVMIIYLMIFGGVEYDDEGRRYRKGPGFVDKLPTEIIIIVGLLSCLGGILILANYSEIVKLYSELDAFMGLAQGCIALMVAVPAGIGLLMLLQLVIKLSQRRLFKDMFLVRAVKLIIKKYHSSEYYSRLCRKTYVEKSRLRHIVMLCCVLVEPPALLIGYNDYNEEFFLLVSFISFIIFMLTMFREIKAGRELAKLSRQIEAIRSGEKLTEEVAQDSAIYAEYTALNGISEAVREAVEEQIRSEKMKIELVANVSHDLKTPLTSIISYIDLLKKLELDDEARDYVMILDRKAEKLKSIVQDVFSLAKATSGIEVKMERIDMVMLFNQCMADEDDMLRDCGRTIKTSVKTDSAPIMGDGAKLYRVFQNIIGNAVKYSLSGTRIFMELDRSRENVVFTIKNTSAEPIDLTAEEPTERFVRGDSSRTDGGSGLGLSIAKTFTEACGGQFDIELEGDMFKAKVIMPLISEKDEKEEPADEDEEA